MNIYACVDIDPTTNKVLGSTIQGQTIETDKPVLLEHAIFIEDGVHGYVVEDKLKLKGLKPVTRTADGDIWNFAGTMPLLSARYALVNPRNGISYTNAV